MPQESSLPIHPAGPGGLMYEIDPARLDGILWRRPFAYFIDVVIICLIEVLAFVAMSPLWAISFGTLTAPIMLVIAAIPIAYHTLQIGSSRSATWGQRLFDLEVQRVDGGRPGLFQAFLQTVLFYVTIGFTSFLILVVVLFNRHCRTVHDFLAGTVTLRRAHGPDILAPGGRA
jgi:uncharacterized RDD family membrane protein YckC